MTPCVYFIIFFFFKSTDYLDQTGAVLTFLLLQSEGALVAHAEQLILSVLEAAFVGRARLANHLTRSGREENFSSFNGEFSISHNVRMSEEKQ